VSKISCLANSSSSSSSSSSLDEESTGGGSLCLPLEVEVLGEICGEGKTDSSTGDRSVDCSFGVSLSVGDKRFDIFVEVLGDESGLGKFDKGM
jgi:hypothetical protein